MAMVLGAKSMFSAAGGYDIGSESPIAQLHPREMVLPANLADNVRSMSGGGGSSLTMKGISKNDLFSGDQLVTMLKQLHRDGHFPGGLRFAR